MSMYLPKKVSLFKFANGHPDDESDEISPVRQLDTPSLSASLDRACKLSCLAIASPPTMFPFRPRLVPPNPISPLLPWPPTPSPSPPPVAPFVPSRCPTRPLPSLPLPVGRIPHRPTPPHPRPGPSHPPDPIQSDPIPSRSVPSHPIPSHSIPSIPGRHACHY